MQVESVLPAEFDASGDVATFLENLPKADAAIAARVAAAKANAAVRASLDNRGFMGRLAPPATPGR